MFLFIRLEPKFGRSVVDVFDSLEGEIDPFYEFFEKFVVAHPVGGVSVAVNEEILKELNFPEKLTLNKSPEEFLDRARQKRNR